MADNSVFITGTASGAFTEAFSDLPPWASEKTALQIEKYLRKSHDIHAKTFDALKKLGSGGGGKMTPEDTKKVNDELDKLGKNLKRNNEEDGKKRKRDRDREKNATDDDKKSSKAGSLLNAALVDVAAIGMKVLGVNKDYIDVYDSMYKSGINVLNGNNSTADGFEALNQIVNLTGMRLQTLQKVVEKYSSTVNAVGLAKFAKTLAQANTQLVSLGYNSEAQAELLGVLVESETGYMDVRNKTSTQLATDAIRLGGQLTKLSQTVGISREQLQENIKANSKSIESSFVFAKYGAQAAETMNKNMAGIKDSGLKDMLMQLASASNPAQVEGYRKLTEAGLGDIAEQFNRIAKSGMTDDVQEFQNKFSAMTGYLQTQTGRMGNLTNLLGAGGEEAARILQAAYQQGNIVSKASTGQQDAAQKTQSAVAGLQTEIESLSAAGQKAFFPLVEQVNLATAGLKKLNGAIDGVIASVEAQTRSWVGIGLSVAGLVAAFFAGKATISKFFDVLSGNRVETLGRAVSGITKGIETFGRFLFSLGGTLVSLAAAFAAGYAIGTILYELVSNFNWFNNMMDKVFSGLDHILKYIPGMGSGAKERIATREKLAAMNNGDVAPKSSVISIPKSPAATTVISPSAVPAEAPPPGKSNDAPAAATTATTNGTTPAAKTGDINSLLVNQGLLLEQILTGTNALVSVNKDILKYARNAS